MSNDIKAGDLVMIYKPTVCCGSTVSIGQLFTAGPIVVGAFGRCPCGAAYRDTAAFDAADGTYVSITRLKKIDPPAIGDSLPTRASLDTPIKELA